MDENISYYPRFDYPVDLERRWENLSREKCIFFSANLKIFKKQKICNEPKKGGYYVLYWRRSKKYSF